MMEAINQAYIASVTPEFTDQVKSSFALLKRRGVIDIKGRSDIPPGAVWMEHLTKIIGASKFIIVLMTPDLIADETFWDLELPTIKAAAKYNGARIFPFIAAPFVDMENHPFAEFDTAIRRGGVTMLNDETLLDLAKAIRKQAEPSEKTNSWSTQPDAEAYYNK